MNNYYNYREEMYNDVCEYINDNIDINDYIDSGGFNRDRLEEDLNDECWIADSVTGNASGSYYCNAYKAREALRGNEEDLIEALECFGDEPESYKEALRSPEYADVTIRCYYLAETVSRVCDALEEAIEAVDIEEVKEYDAEYIYNVIVKGA